jgi:lipopolysaccharide/colanic/teichoic acid biosynthesis glycosyltransferase
MSVGSHAGPQPERLVTGFVAAHRRPGAGGYRLAKRALDILLSGAGLAASSPIWAILAAAIKLEDGGPVFFPQARVGQGGRTFRALKFRSMIVDADRSGAPRQAALHDPRVTRVGRIMRATALDELPQLWNIFRGDMSFVGPRPLVPGEIEVNGGDAPVPLDAIEGYEERHSLRPGLTGIAQIYAARDVPRAEKFKLDLLYVQRASFRLDVQLILISFWITFRGRWEHRGSKV